MGTTLDSFQRGAVGGTRVHKLVQTALILQDGSPGSGLWAGEHTTPGKLFVMLFTVPVVENGNCPLLCVCVRALCL